MKHYKVIIKDYKKDFDNKLLDDSYEDGQLLSIAREYIMLLQDIIINQCGGVYVCSENNKL